MNKSHLKLLIIALLFVFARFASAQTTGFTYQGKLSDGAMAATGSFEMQFRLFDTPQPGTGTQAGDTLTFTAQTNNAVNVSNGIFTVTLDFRFSPFAAGASRYLEIGIRRAGETTFKILMPRQFLTSSPYAIQTLSAMTANALSESCVGCVTDEQVASVSGSKITGTVTNASNLGGIAASNFVQSDSTAFVRNQTTQQTSTDFNVGGTGAADIFNARTEFRLGGSRVLSIAGIENLFAGAGAGSSNTSGTYNAFAGYRAGFSNTTGYSNAFFGDSAGTANTSGNRNAFVGTGAGTGNTTGDNNTLLGNQANVGAGDLTHATAIGADARVFSSNTVVLGRAADIVRIPGNLSVSGTLSAATDLRFGDVRVLSTLGTNNLFAGALAGNANTTGSFNTFVGSIAGTANTTGNRNAFFGNDAGISNTTGSQNTLLGNQANVGASDLTYATAVGAGAVVRQSNTIVLGRENGQDSVRIYRLGSAGNTQICLNAVNEFASCSSSLRYKTNIAPFLSGLNLINQLKPISFDWKDGGMKDVGFGAEDVAAINPLLVNYNTEGEVEGVKYDRLSVLFVNAFKEQQTQIAAQQTRIEAKQEQLNAMQERLEQQQTLLDALKKLLCTQNSTANVCRQP